MGAETGRVTLLWGTVTEADLEICFSSTPPHFLTEAASLSQGMSLYQQVYQLNILCAFLCALGNKRKVLVLVCLEKEEELRMICLAHGGMYIHIKEGKQK